MLPTFTVVIRERKSKDSSVSYEGVVQIPGLSNTTRLANKEGQTSFQSRSALTTVARALAKRLNWEVLYDEPKKIAAKKSPTSSKKSVSSSKKSTKTSVSAKTTNS